MMFLLIIVSLVFALVPALVFSANLRAYAPLSSSSAGLEFPPVSVLIPARNEENAIGDAVRAVLQSQGIKFEVVVLDDHSEDRTAAIVEQLIATDERVRLVSAPALPAGWCGKQHACWVLAREARNSLLLFIDADVRLAPRALASMAAFVSSSGADLASGIPLQVTSSLLEKLLIPLIHFILLGFLPIRWMRRSRQPLFAAGCGQVFIVRAQAYHCCGGHSVIRDSLHDGIKLPRAFRAAGFTTDLFDATDLATCRMYRTAAEVWFGLAKNACEALAAPTMIGPMTALLLGGQVLPVLLLLLALYSWPEPWPRWQILTSLVATCAAYYPRLVAIGRYRQSLLGAIVHPLGILILLAIQWFALLSNALGRPSSWKGRPYPTPRVQSDGLVARELEPTT
jgi:Glycosyl transferase family 2